MKKTSVILLAVFAAATVSVSAAVAKKEVELQGKLGCAHCSYHKGDGCAVGFKTGDGKLYVLENADDKLMEARMKGGQIKVTGTVTEKDGYATVNASKTELVK